MKRPNHKIRLSDVVITLISLFITSFFAFKGANLSIALDGPGPGANVSWRGLLALTLLGSMTVVLGLWASRRSERNYAKWFILFCIPYGILCFVSTFYIARYDWQIRCDQEDAVACYAYAGLRWKGRLGLKKDPSKAEALDRKGCTLGAAPSCRRLVRNNVKDACDIFSAYCTRPNADHFTCKTDDKNPCIETPPQPIYP